MQEKELWDLYQQYRMKQHQGRSNTRESQYWQGRADMILVIAKSLGYQVNFEPAEY